MAYASGVIKVTLKGTLANAETFAHGFQLFSADAVANVVRWDEIGGIVKGYLDTLAARTAYYALIPPETAYTGFDMQLYDGGTTAIRSYSDVIVGGVGTSAGNPLPNQCCVVASIRTELAGRSNRGRSYLPAPSASTISSTTAQLNNATCTAIADWFGGLLAAIGADADGATPVVASRLTGAVTTVTAVTVDSVIDTQRSRRASAVAAFSSTELV